MAGPGGHWLGGCMGELQRDVMGFATRANREFGHYVRIRFVPGFSVYLLTHPNAVEHVLQKNQRNYRKPGMLTGAMGLLVGNGLFTSEGDTWRRQRRMMQPAFNRERVAALVPAMVRAAEEFADLHAQGEPGRVIEMSEEMTGLSLRIAAATLFGSDVGEVDAIAGAYRVAYTHVSRRMRSVPPVPSWLPTRANREFAQAKGVLDRLVLHLIAARRGRADQPPDLLSLLLAAQDEETGAAMSDQAVLDEAHTLLLAGHETSAAALSWTWYLLGRHPQVQHHVCDEVRGRLQGRSAGIEDIAHLPLTRAVFEEALRLYPPAPGIARQSIRADEIDGFTIPANAIVNLCQYVTHRHADLWDEPDAFRPERFLPGGEAESRHKFAYFPFGSGPRVCIGSSFALMEGVLVLATILQRLRIELASAEAPELDATFALRPWPGVPVRLYPRE
jgi:cytochrome P450